jgi:hypothetical protein
MLVAISCLRNSGVLDFIVDGMKMAVNYMGIDNRFTDAMPTALLHPVSGSGSRAMMIDTMKTFGPDSFAGRLSCVFHRPFRHRPLLRLCSSTQHSLHALGGISGGLGGDLYSYFCELFVFWVVVRV